MQMPRIPTHLLVLLGLAVGSVAHTMGSAPLQTAASSPSLTAEAVDADVNARIREEGLERSRLPWLTHILTDVHGPRLTGSPNLEEAGQWAIDTMAGWGLTNGRMEPWNWGHEGWRNDRAVGHAVEPFQDQLEFEVIAWTPSTNGTVRTEVVHLVPPQGPPVEAGGGTQVPRRLGPTRSELDEYLTSIAAAVENRIVLVGAWSAVPVDFSPSPLRAPDDQVRQRFAPSGPAGAGGPARGRAGPGGRGGGANSDRLTPQQVDVRVAEFLRTHRPALRIFDAARPHGQIAAYNVAGYDSTRTVPTILMRNEDFGRIARIVAEGTPVTLEFTIVNRTFPEGRTAYNAIAEIPGTDRADETVMLGGHLDSWHAATGATDNAIGCAVVMEAVRILKAIGVQPRRTIRVALWSGEEQGLLGSRAYVAEHFGTAEDPRPAFSSLTAYWNVDGGTGRIRGARVFGPPAAAAVLAGILRPFEDLGVFGASATRSRSGGGTDSGSFNMAGLPGISTDQDPIEYESHTHHTNLDTYERIVWEDARHAAIVTASAVYHLAMRDDPLPRFTIQEMPAPPGGRGGGR